MSEQTKRQQLETHLTRRALLDPGFRDELLKNPKVAIEKEMGLKFPEALTIAVHEEKLTQLHVVLPVDLVTGDDLAPPPLDSGRNPAGRGFWRKN
jgi:hypothetical protein